MSQDMNDAVFSVADKNNLQQTVADLMDRLTEAEKNSGKVHTHRITNTVNAQIAQKKKDAVIFLVEKAATICPYTYRELPFPDNLWFGKNIECIVSLFTQKSEITEALISPNKGFRAKLTEYNFIGLAVLFNTARDNDELTDTMSTTLAKIHQHFDPQLAVVVSLPKREINVRPFMMLRETNANFGVFDNKVNRTYDEQINALRGWLVAMIKSIKPTTGTLFNATTQSNGGGKATNSTRGRGRGRGRGGRGRGRGGGGLNY